MTIEVCDICEHEIGISLASIPPLVFKYRPWDDTEISMLLCRRCAERLTRVIRMESRKEWKKELKGMRT